MSLSRQMAEVSTGKENYTQHKLLNIKCGYAPIITENGILKVKGCKPF